MLKPEAGCVIGMREEIFVSAVQGAVMSMEYNNATVVRFEQLPTACFIGYAQIGMENPHRGFQAFRLGVMEKPEEKKTLRAMTIIDVQDGAFYFIWYPCRRG